MKQGITLAIFIMLFLFVTLWLILNGIKKDVLPIGCMLPKIKYETLIGFHTLEGDKRNKILIVYFKKGCSHCEYELSILNKNLNKIHDTKIYLFTSDEDYLGNQEMKTYNSLLSSERVIWGFVQKNDFVELFGGIRTPSFYFFSEDGILKAKIIGETKIEGILKEL